MKTIGTVIIGGSLSGLAAGHFLQERGDNDFLILEREPEPGGYCRTLQNRNYVWDYAGHFYHFQTKKYRDLFLSLVGPEEIVKQQKNSKIYYHGKLIDYPFQKNIHQLNKEEFIDCLYDLYTKEQYPSGDNFLDMLYSKFGRAITEKFLRPYNEKLYATDLHKLDTNAMGRFFPYADIKDIILNMKLGQAGSYNDNFLYLKHGTGYFINKLAEPLKGHLRLNTTITALDPKEHLLTTVSGEQYKYKRLINTIPFNQFLALFGEQHPELSYNKVLVFNLGFDKDSEQYRQEHWVYFPDKNLNFYRVGFYNHILGDKKLSLYVEIGFPKDATIDQQKELKATLAGLKEVGIINNTHRLLDSATLLMNPAYIHISTKEAAFVENRISELAEHDIFTLGRYGRWTYNSMEDCIALADELVQGF